MKKYIYVIIVFLILGTFQIIPVGSAFGETVNHERRIKNVTWNWISVSPDGKKVTACAEWGKEEGGLLRIFNGKAWSETVTNFRMLSPVALSENGSIGKTAGVIPRNNLETSVLLKLDGNMIVKEAEYNEIPFTRFKSFCLTTDGKKGYAVGWKCRTKRTSGEMLPTEDKYGFIMQYASGKWKSLNIKGVDELRVMFSVCLTPEGRKGWAVGAKGTILYYDGEEWGLYELDTPVKKDLYSVCISDDGKKAIAVGEAGTILSYSDKQWSQISLTGITAKLNSVSLSSDFSKGFIVGNDGLIILIEGDSYRKYKSPELLLSEADLKSVSMAKDGTKAYAVSSKYILEYKDDKWEKIYTEKR